MLIAIFSASWLNRQATKKLLTRLEKRFDVKSDEVLAEIRKTNKKLKDKEKRQEIKIAMKKQRNFKPILPINNN